MRAVEAHFVLRSEASIPIQLSRADIQVLVHADRGAVGMTKKSLSEDAF